MVAGALLISSAFLDTDDTILIRCAERTKFNSYLKRSGSLESAVKSSFKISN